MARTTEIHHISLTPGLKDRAKKAGLNVSGICEKAITEAVLKLESKATAPAEVS